MADLLAKQNASASLLNFDLLGVPRISSVAKRLRRGRTKIHAVIKRLLERPKFRPSPDARRVIIATKSRSTSPDWLNCSHFLFSSCRLRYLRFMNWGGWQDLNRSCSAGLCLNFYTQLSGQLRCDP
jgi:hypothetical protein